MTSDLHPTTVTVAPAGPLLVDAAAWVGAACWAELRLHQALTDLLADIDAGTNADQAVGLWAVRSRRAELAAAWHQRLPELRELPRSGFVEPTPEVTEVLAPLTTPAPADPLAAVAEVLDGLVALYQERQTVAVGPADGPTASTLLRALADTETDRTVVRVLRSP